MMMLPYCPVKYYFNFCWRKFIAVSILSISALSLAAQKDHYKTVDSSFLQIVNIAEPVVKAAGGFGFLEGPLWSNKGYLLFSDLRVNKIFKLAVDGKTEVYINNSGFSGAYHNGLARDYGSDALAFDKEGNLLVCQHGNHAVAIVTADKPLHTLIDSYQGKRLNSPDDIAVKSDGSLYFTDPPYIFPKQDADTAKKQKDNGIYQYKNGQLRMINTDYRFPNGICFSPGEKYFYVCSYGKDEPVRRYQVAADGSIQNGKVIYKQNGDGLKTDSLGNLYLCNYLGISVLTPEGKLLGIIKCPESVTNINWGGADFKTLFIVAQTSVYKVRMKVPGPKHSY